MKSLRTLATALAALLLYFPTSSSQSLNTGSFIGTVRDPSGAAVPGAVVKIRRVATTLERQTESNAEGTYQLLQMPPGEYVLEFRKEGFQTFLQENVSLSSGQTLRIDVPLKVGAVSEAVRVEAAVSQVNTASANVGATVYGTQVQELALTTRSFTQLVSLQPGVASNQAQQPGFGSNTSVPFSFNGSPQSSNNWLLDGGRNQDTYNGNNLTMVNLDAIAEVRIERNAYSSEYGRNSGAQINVVTRSGTNSFHGSAFEFFRNDKLDARNFFAVRKQKNRYNNFGWTLGGPIKRDKVFFFLSNEYRRIRQATSTRTSIVPTDTQIAGNFAGDRTITDPLTQQPFPGNIIPATRIDPNAQILLREYYARPTPGYRQGALNFTSSEPDGTKYRSALGRLDYNIKPDLTAFARYNIDSTRLDSPYGLFASNSMPNAGASEQSHIMYASSAGLTWTARPNLLNQTNVSYYHGSMAISTVPFASRARVPSLQLPRYFEGSTASGSLIPSISMGQGYAGIQIIWPQNISHYTFELQDNVTWISGRHTFKFGAYISRDNKTQNQSNANNNGAFTFNGSATGDSLADLLLGRAFTYSENSSHITGSVRFTDYAFYLQDQVRIHDRLTLTLGGRYEFFQPEQDSAGTISFFSPSAWSAGRAPTVLPNGEIVVGTENFGNGIVVAGEDAPFGFGITNSRRNTFAPRVGFSYLLTEDNKTVLRGGYGMFHDRWPQYASATRNNYPFNQNISIYNTFLSNPATGTRRIFPSGVTSMGSPWEIPYMQKWSLDVQRQLPGDLLLEVGYVGSKGTHLIRTRDINQPLPNVDAALGRISPNSLRPYAGFAGINTYWTDADSSYHSLQASGVRRFSNGFSMQASYTWSKSIDNSSTPQNAFGSNRMERALSNVDRTHIFIASYVWELPLGRNSTGLRKKLYSGWQVSGITSLQSGNPVSVVINGDRLGTGVGGQRPDLLGPIELTKRIDQWFSGSFALPAYGTFGTAGRNIVRGPGINNWDLSFSKRTAITERVNTQLRIEMFNAFNHTQWSGIGTTIGAATFGQVVSARDPRIMQLGLRLLF